MPTFADIYAACLYVSGEGYPLWNPSPLRLGDVGYVRDGSFVVLYNAVDGPGRLSDAASIPLARRSNRSSSLERTRRDSDANLSKMESEDSVYVLTDAESSSRRPSTAQSSLPTSLPPGSLGVSRSAASDFVLPSAAKKGSPTFAHRALRSGTPPEGPFPPMPLQVDREAPKLFDMGPRMSSNYRCLGLDGGVAIAGTPVGVKIGFESSGGDGAILIPRDPTERTLLKHQGVLKAYIKAHYKWMYETYGRIEAIGIDDLGLIYGQDRTSDWAVAVSRDSARGAKVEFEIFGSSSAGFWGNWSHTLSACQRGPHRSQAASGTHNEAQAEPPSGGHKGPSWGASIEGGVVNTSFSFSSSSFDTQADRGRPSGRRCSKPSRKHSVTWSPAVHAAPDQTISIRRITASTVRCLGLFPARPKAAAEPRDPDVNRDHDHNADAVGRQDGNGAEASVRKHRPDDPLEALHGWIHEQGKATTRVSIASDDDCLQLLARLGWEQVAVLGLRAALRLAACRFARIAVDDAGIAMVSVGADRDLFAVARRAVEKADLRPRPFKSRRGPSSSRLSSMRDFGCALPSLVVP